MGDIENFVYDYCSKNITTIMIIVFTPFLLKTNYKCVKLFLNVSKNEKIVMISDDYHDIGRLLLITIIASSKNRLLSNKISWLIGKTG